MSDLLSLANAVLMKKALVYQKSLESRSLGNETGDFLTKKGDFGGDLKKPDHWESNVALGLQRETGNETDRRLWSNSGETSPPKEQLKSLMSSDEFKQLDKIISNLELVLGHMEVEIKRITPAQSCSTSLISAGATDQILKPDEGVTCMQVQEGDVLTAAYANNRMIELGLKPEDVRGETDSSLKLDSQELEDTRRNKASFDIWVEHVHQFKQMKRFGLIKP